MHGHISRASDVFAFGILLWELYTGDHAYKGIPRALLGHNISKQGMRPVFPPDTPFEWQFLACRCWESDPAIRSVWCSCCCCCCCWILKQPTNGWFRWVV